MRPAFRIVDTVRGPFALGTKEIYLCAPYSLTNPPSLHPQSAYLSSILTLHPQTNLHNHPPPQLLPPPTFAKFMVPLNLNKLDLRDYLYNAYGVKVLSVRSFVAQSPVRQDKPDAERPKPRKWYRERAKKFMVAELERPFVWPDVPEDFSPCVLTLSPFLVDRSLHRRAGGGFGAWGYQWEDMLMADVLQMGQRNPRRRRKRTRNFPGDHDARRINQAPRGRDTMAEQARRLLEGKERWQPTWQALEAKRTAVPEHDPLLPADAPRVP
ncbi:mitochondrial 54S ribosomal protein YmL41 [Coniosporium tulheliwenetii]|uniref:Mitochondrial 54S ribosomal protein YmL41 n=1 Tax=Coniosporium tulheliwenetii TaxID=3383036 RepID=A0ACC2ZKJ2_9PEZI|nr:mitochondrial 54S ribosomal protein YmL41 [Cladosporium sp. JES 115]